MKIARIERFPIAVKPVDEDLIHSGKSPDYAVIIIVHTDTGLTGLGEAAAISTDDSRSLPTLLKWLVVYQAALTGADALNINAAHYLLDQASGQHPPGCHAARAAVDMALHDIVGKARGCPVHEILGGKYRSEMELTIRIEGETPEEVAVSARASVSQGFRGLKVGIGDKVLPAAQSIPQIEQKFRRLLAVLEAVGTDVYVDADANQSLGNPAVATMILERVLRKRYYANLALQQPLHKLDFMGHAFLREKLLIPVILSESVVSTESMMQIERVGAADRIELNIGRVGGLFNALRIADICEAAAIGIGLAVPSYTGIGLAAHCHLAAALRDPFPLYIGARRRALQSLALGGPEIRDGRAILRDVAGLGVAIDEDLLRSMATHAGAEELYSYYDIAKA